MALNQRISLGKFILRVNLITCITMYNMIIALVFLKIIDFSHIFFECLFSLMVLPFLFSLNRYKNYVWTAYGFYVIGFSFLASMCLKMGIDSYIILF